jgi:hypothetical protein
VSDRDAAALREMTRLGLKPGVAITVEAGMRNASLWVRVGGGTDAVRLRQALASEISVIPGLSDGAGKESGSSNDSL